MTAMFCPSCRLKQPTNHRFCARCGSDLPSELVTARAKTARFFAGVKVAAQDPTGGYLRVSHYSGTERLEEAGASLDVATEHVRFSVWVDDRATCVISLPASEARALSEFLREEFAGHTEPLTAEPI
jgi:hypothetical protein